MRELPPPGHVDLVVVHDVSTLASSLLVTNAEEQVAARHARPELARRSRGARGLMRLVASQYLGCRPVEVPIVIAACVLCGELHGKPEIDGSPVQINLSHAGDTVLIGASSSPLGVDVEPESGRGESLALSKRFYSPAEAEWVREGASPEEIDQRFLRLWVRKEAVLKATGEGLPGGIGSVPVLGSSPLTLTRSVAGRSSTWTVADVDSATLPSAAVAVGGEACELNVLGLADLDHARQASGRSGRAGS
jgi:4'-phosphopantetheinyl transferase